MSAAGGSWALERAACSSERGCVQQLEALHLFGRLSQVETACSFVQTLPQKLRGKQ